VRGDRRRDRAAVPLPVARTTLDTIISWKLAPEGSGTRLTLVHEGFDLDTPMGRRAFEGMKPGWPGVLVKLGTAIDDAT
jgi:hypothetical protein